MEFFKLAIYMVTVIYLVFVNVSKKGPSKLDFVCLTLSYVCFGLAWVIEGFGN